MIKNKNNKKTKLFQKYLGKIIFFSIYCDSSKVDTTNIPLLEKIVINAVK